MSLGSATGCKAGATAQPHCSGRGVTPSTPPPARLASALLVQFKLVQLSLLLDSGHPSQCPTPCGAGPQGLLEAGIGWQVHRRPL